MATKKGIAVLNASTGNVVHKLMNDGSAQLGESSDSAITMNGTIKLEGLSVPTKAGKMVAAGTEGAAASDDVAVAINGIDGSLQAEITAASTRRGAVDDAIEDLRDAAGLVDGQEAADVSATANSDLNGQNLGFGFTHTSTTFISGVSTLKAADVELDKEIKRQNDAIGVLNGAEGDDGSVKKAIAAVRGTLVEGDLDTMEEMRTSIGADNEFAKNMVIAINDAIDDLDGVIGGNNQNVGLNDSMDDVETLLENERDRRKGNKDDVEEADVESESSVTAGELADEGTQGWNQKQLDDIQLAIGHQAEGALGAGITVKPAARDIDLANKVKVMEGRQSDLINVKFEAQGLTVTGTAGAVIDGHMKFDGDGASFNFPTMTAAEVASMGLTNSDTHNGKVFYLSSEDSACADAISNDNLAEDFADGKKLYFCEKGVWHSSYLLKEQQS